VILDQSNGGVRQRRMADARRERIGVLVIGKGPASVLIDDSHETLK
jgi:hypothetical protein